MARWGEITLPEINIGDGKGDEGDGKGDDEDGSDGVQMIDSEKSRLFSVFQNRI